MTDVEAAWGAIKDDPRLKDIQEAAKAVLTTWITREAKSKNPEDISENRHYQDNEELIRALVGEVKSADNVKHEGKLAAQTMSDEQVNAGLGTFVTRLKQFHAKHEAALAEAKNKGGRYRGWAYGDKDTTIGSGPGERQRPWRVAVASVALPRENRKL